MALNWRAGYLKLLPFNIVLLVGVIKLLLLIANVEIGVVVVVVVGVAFGFDFDANVRRSLDEILEVQDQLLIDLSHKFMLGRIGELFIVLVLLVLFEDLGSLVLDSKIIDSDVLERLNGSLGIVKG